MRRLLTIIVSGFFLVGGSLAAKAMDNAVEKKTNEDSEFVLEHANDLFNAEQGILASHASHSSHSSHASHSSHSSHSSHRSGF